MSERAPQIIKKARAFEVVISDVSHELPLLKDTELIDWLDALRLADRKPARRPKKESVDETLILAEARRRADLLKKESENAAAADKPDIAETKRRLAYLLTEAADAVEEIITGKNNNGKR